MPAKQKTGLAAIEAAITSLQDTEVGGLNAALINCSDIEAMQSLADNIRQLGLDHLYEVSEGRVSIHAMRFEVDHDMPLVERDRFSIGHQGVDLGSVTIRRLPSGAWILCDRWGDGLLIALHPNVNLEAIDFTPDLLK